MIPSTIPRLQDMCATSIMYRLWTRQDIYENWGKNNHWQLLECKVTSDVKNLPLPELLTSLSLLSLVKPSGRHFFGFLNVWLTKIATSEKWLTKGMLCDCLTLYPVGIINQRKTAEKLLRSKILDNVIAFRLACINFLEREVLRLWPCVSRYILNKIVLEQQNIQFPNYDNITLLSRDYRMVYNINEYGYVQETCEVLFWIGYCLSKEEGTSLNAVPHYAEGSSIWHRTSLSLVPYYASQGFNIWYSDAAQRAGISGDISFSDYAKNSSITLARRHHEDQIITHCLGSNNFLISFFYHFSWIKIGIRVRLFRRYPRQFTLYFLQWPLSSLFLDNLNRHQELFNALFELNLLDWLLVTILEILHGVSYVRHTMLTDRETASCTPSPKLKVSDVYCSDHMKQIWVALWKLCPDETKSRIMDSFVFTNNFNSFLERASHEMNFDVSTLKKGVLEVFRLHNEAILKFLEVENLADALEKVISDYMPERKLDFRSLQLPQFSNKPNYEIKSVEFLAFPRIRYLRTVAGLQLPFTNESARTVIRPIMKFDLREIKNVVAPKFINYIQEFLFCNNTNAFFYS